MAHSIELSLAAPPPYELLGPAMRALNERQRCFVCALAVFGGDHSEAYRVAGFKTTNDNATAACASRLFNQIAVQDAIKEEALRRLDSSALLGVSTLIELASHRNEDKKTRKAAADSLLDRIGGFGGKTEHKIVIKDDRTVAELVEFIQARAGAHGLDAAKLLGLPAPTIIEAEFEEVPDGRDGLEDVL